MNLFRNYEILRLFRKGLKIKEIGKILGLSASRVDIILTEQQNRQFITKGRYCYECGKIVNVFHLKKQPILATCKNGHMSTVAYNCLLNCFDVM